MVFEGIRLLPDLLLLRSGVLASRRSAAFGELLTRVYRMPAVKRACPVDPTWDILYDPNESIRTRHPLHEGALSALALISVRVETDGRTSLDTSAGCGRLRRKKASACRRRSSSRGGESRPESRAFFHADRAQTRPSGSRSQNSR